MSTLKNDVLVMAKELVGQNLEHYSSDRVKTEEALRQALIQANGGSTQINPRNIYPGSELFQIIPELIQIVSDTGLKGDEFFMNYVDYRNVAEGDMNEFYTEDDDTFIVSEIGRGNQAIRRQRLGNGVKYTVPTTPYAIRVYEHYSRLMSGRADWSTFVARVSKSTQDKKYESIFGVFESITKTTPGMYNEVEYTGTYDEDSLLSVIEHVEADNGGAGAKIIGTRGALRQLRMDILADQAKSDMYNVGYYGKFYGIPTFCIRSRYKTGTHDFIFPSDRLYIIASDEKFIKFVTEGTPLLKTVDPFDNMDLTQELWHIEQYGVRAELRHAIGLVTLVPETTP